MVSYRGVRAPWPAALVSGMLLLAACGTSGQPAASGGTLKIGAILPLTGANASLGDDQRRGIDLALGQVNNSGGVLGMHLDLVLEDSQNQANAALDAARKLVDVNKVPVIIGEYSSGITIPVGQYLVSKKILHINPGSTSPRVRQIGPYSFSTMGLDDLASKFIAKVVYARGYRKVAFLAPNNAFGSGLGTATQASFEALGGAVVASVLYTTGQQDYKAELQRLAGAKPDVFVYSAYGQESAIINREAFELGLNKTAPWFGIYLSQDTIDSDPKTVEGQVGMDDNYIGPDGAAYQDLYKKKYGTDFASSFSGYTYDAVMMVAAAIKKANSTDPTAIRDALRQIGQNYKGVTGTITFDAQGQRVDQPFILAQFKGGKIVQLSG